MGYPLVISTRLRQSIRRGGKRLGMQSCRITFPGCSLFLFGKYITITPLIIRLNDIVSSFPDKGLPPPYPSPFATEPPMDGLCVQAIFLTKRSGEILFLRCDEDVMAGNNRRQEQEESPGQVERQRNSCQETNAAQVEGISSRSRRPPW